MTAGLDTSVALRLLTGTPADQAEIARLFVASEKSAVLVSDLVISETYYALRHHYSVPHTQAVHALTNLLSDSRIRPTGNSRRVLAELSIKSSKNSPGLVDRLIHADYARDETALVTFDRELAKITGVKHLK